MHSDIDIVHRPEDVRTKLQQGWVDVKAGQSLGVVMGRKQIHLMYHPCPPESLHKTTCVVVLRGV